MSVPSLLQKAHRRLQMRLSQHAIEVAIESPFLYFGSPCLVTPYRGESLKHSSTASYRAWSDVKTSDAVICIHLERNLERSLWQLHQCWAAGHTKVLLCGWNDVGAKSIASRWKKRGVAFEALEQVAHHRLFWVRPQTEMAQVSIADVSDCLYRLDDSKGLHLKLSPGVFGAKKPDRGTQVLLDVLADAEPVSTTLDVAAGAGALGLGLLMREQTRSVLALEHDDLAVQDLKHNATSFGLDECVQAYWWDAQEGVQQIVAQHQPDRMVINPPFHNAWGECRELGIHMVQDCIEQAPATCEVWCVVNEHLPYERELRQLGSIISGKRRIRQLVNRAGFDVLLIR